MTEPAGIPAFSAPSFGLKRPILAPVPVYELSKKTPRTGRVDLPLAINSSITRLASFIGIAKPNPMLPLVPPEDKVAIAELTPMILP